MHGVTLDEVRSPSLGNCNYPIFPSRRLHRPIYFSFEFMSNYDPHWNLSDNCNHKHGHIDMMSTCSRAAALFYPYRSVDWNWRIVGLDWPVKMPLHWPIVGGVAGSYQWVSDEV